MNDSGEWKHVKLSSSFSLKLDETKRITGAEFKDVIKIESSTGELRLVPGRTYKFRVAFVSDGLQRSADEPIEVGGKDVPAALLGSGDSALAEKHAATPREVEEWRWQEPVVSEPSDTASQQMDPLDYIRTRIMPGGPKVTLPTLLSTDQPMPVVEPKDEGMLWTGVYIKWKLHGDLLWCERSRPGVFVLQVNRTWDTIKRGRGGGAGDASSFGINEWSDISFRKETGEDRERALELQARPTGAGGSDSDESDDGDRHVRSKSTRLLGAAAGGGSEYMRVMVSRADLEELVLPGQVCKFRVKSFRTGWEKQNADVWADKESEAIFRPESKYSDDSVELTVPACMPVSKPSNSPRSPSSFVVSWHASCVRDCEVEYYEVVVVSSAGGILSSDGAQLAMERFTPPMRPEEEDQPYEVTISKEKFPRLALGAIVRSRVRAFSKRFGWAENSKDSDDLMLPMLWPPGRPTGLTLERRGYATPVPLSATEIQLTWKNPTFQACRVSKYEISVYEHTTNSDGSDGSDGSDASTREPCLQWRLGMAATSHIMAGLESGHSYTFAVRALAVSGRPKAVDRVEYWSEHSELSSPVQMPSLRWTQESEWAAPKVAALSPTELKVEWLAPDAQACELSFYELELADASGRAVRLDPPQQHRVAASDISTTLSSLVPGTVYRVRVRAEAPIGSNGLTLRTALEVWSEPSKAVVMPQLSAPLLPVATSLAPGSVHLVWTRPIMEVACTIGAYEVEVCEVVGDDEVPIDDYGSRERPPLLVEQVELDETSLPTALLPLKRRLLAATFADEGGIKSEGGPHAIERNLPKDARPAATLRFRVRAKADGDGYRVDGPWSRFSPLVTQPIFGRIDSGGALVGSVAAEPVSSSAFAVAWSAPEIRGCKLASSSIEVLDASKATLGDLILDEPRAGALNVGDLMSTTALPSLLARSAPRRRCIVLTETPSSEPFEHGGEYHVRLSAHATITYRPLGTVYCSRSCGLLFERTAVDERAPSTISIALDFESEASVALPQVMPPDAPELEALSTTSACARWLAPTLAACTYGRSGPMFDRLTQSEWRMGPEEWRMLTEDDLYAEPSLAMPPSRPKTRPSTSQVVMLSSPAPDGWAGSASFSSARLSDTVAEYLLEIREGAPPFAKEYILRPDQTRGNCPVSPLRIRQHKSISLSSTQNCPAFAFAL